MEVPVKNENDKKKGCFAITKVDFNRESEDESEMEEHPPDNGDSLDGSMLENIEEQRTEEEFLNKANAQNLTDNCRTADVELKKAFERSESTDTLRADDSSDAGQQEGKKEVSNSRFKVFKMKSERGRWKCVDFFDDDKTVIIYETIKGKQAASPTLSISPHSHISISQLTHSKNDIFFNSLHICSYCPHHSNPSNCYCKTFPTCLIPHSPNHPTSPTSFNIVHPPNKQQSPSNILQHKNDFKTPNTTPQSNPNVGNSTPNSPLLELTTNSLCDNNNPNSLTNTHTTNNTLNHNDPYITEHSNLNENIESLLDQSTNTNNFTHTYTQFNEHTNTPSSNTNIHSNTSEKTTSQNFTPNGYNQNKSSSIEISQKIARALDLAKAHLILTTQSEMELMRKRIGSLQSLVDILNHENHLLRDYIRDNDRPVDNNNLQTRRDSNPTIDAILAQSPPNQDNISQHMSASSIEALCSLRGTNLPNGTASDCGDGSDLCDAGDYGDNKNVNNNNKSNIRKVSCGKNNASKDKDLIRKFMNGFCKKDGATDISNNNHNHKNDKNNKNNTKNNTNLKESNTILSKISNNDTNNNDNKNNNNNNKVNDHGRHDNDIFFSNRYCSDEDDGDDDDFGKDRRKIAKLKKDRKIKMNNLIKNKKYHNKVNGTINTDKSTVNTKDNCNHSCVHCCSNKNNNNNNNNTNNMNNNHSNTNTLVVSNKKNVRSYQGYTRMHHKSEG